jgi:hypothetical protein
MRASSLALALAVAMCACAGVARAGEPNESGGAAAESLFQEGRKAMDAKRYGEACPKFLASHKLAPAIGSVLNLADCYEKNGQLASAWARFHEAISLAQRLGRPDREKTAKDRADKLEPRLIRLTIYSQDTGVEVKLDGNVLDNAVLGTPVPVDPGKHTIEASAKGKKSFSTALEVSERTKTPSVEIPELDADEPQKATPKAKVEPEPPQPGGGGGAQRAIGIVAVSVGVVGLGVGTYFGLSTSSKWADAKTHCSGLECDRTGVDLAEQAKSAGNISTIAFIAGGVLVAGGAVLYFTAPRARTTAIGVGPGSLLVRGSF